MVVSADERAIALVMEMRHQKEHHAIMQQELAEAETIRLLILSERISNTSIKHTSLEHLLALKKYLWEATDTHRHCERERCQPMSFREGQPFTHPITKQQYQATGRVYICHVSGLSHLCGSGRCREMYISATNEYCCRISGVIYGSVLAVNPYQNMHRRWEGANDQVDADAEMYEDDANLNEDLDERDDDLVYMDPNGDFIHDSNSSNTAVYNDTELEGQGRADNEIGALEAIMGGGALSKEEQERIAHQHQEEAKLEKREREIDQKIHHLLHRFRTGAGGRQREFSGLPSDNHNYAISERIVRDLLFGHSKKNTAQNKCRAAVLSGDRAVKKYLKECAQHREIAVAYWCYVFFLDATKDYVHEEQDQYNTNIVQYYVKIVLQLWSLILSTRYARDNVSLFHISNHVPATLYLLREGMMVRKFDRSFELLPRDQYMIARLPPVTEIRTLNISSRALTKGSQVIQRCFESAMEHAESTEQLEGYELRSHVPFQTFQVHD